MTEITAVQGDDLAITVTVGGSPDLSGGTYAAQIKPDYAKYDVTAVNTGTKTFTVNGRCDSTTSLDHTDSVIIDGSTGNDGTYTVVSATYDEGTDTTAIVVSDTVSDSTADGVISAWIATLTVDSTNAATGVFILEATGAVTAAFRPSSNTVSTVLVDRSFAVYDFDVTISGETTTYAFGKMYLQREVRIA